MPTANTVDIRRVYALKNSGSRSGPVVYWMSRDQRASDNWALVYAQEEALRRRSPLIVFFCLAPSFLGAAVRHYEFLLKGLGSVEKALREKGVPFFILEGEPAKAVPPFLAKTRAGLLVTDFDPLRIKGQWKEAVIGRIDIPAAEVDAHNIVPCRYVSDKQEFGAYTIRPKIKSALIGFFKKIPVVKRHPYKFKGGVKKIGWKKLIANTLADSRVGPVSWIEPGEKAAGRALAAFLKDKLSEYDVARNDPNLDGQSGLSPYLHFGQLSAQRVALEVERSGAPRGAKDAFLEELIVRRELSDNFCLHNRFYDDMRGAPHWAKRSHNFHRKDRREYVYGVRGLETGRTHDELWNAAQTEMLRTGKMHGYMRMYWAKKILEWTKSPEEALKTAIYLNDRYSLDGRDPNGYAGIMWSIAGTHDRAWFDRPVFGKVRYMNRHGCEKKFDVPGYIKKVKDLDR